ncbi:MAG: nucleoside hydrolase [Chloroflexi bacterium]|nr:nucleoside hydrolase [Chloroflexota bacterium]
MPTKLILDTDIGSDVDDCLALALILASPEIELIGVTTVYGDVALRARMVTKLLQLRGVTGVPVAMGAAKPLLGKRRVYWGGHEGKGLLTPADNALQPSAEHAADLIVRTVMAQPREIVLAAIGPLTNVALAFLKEPRLAQNLAGLTIMGGVVGGAGALHLPWTEHNIRCDPEAAHIVFSSGAALTVVPLDVTTQVRIRREDVARIRAAGDPFHDAVADQVLRYPHFIEHGGWTHLHDPLAITTLLDPSLVELQPVRITIETQGEHTAGATLVSLPTAEAPATARIALRVDAPAAERFIVERLTH